MRERTSAWVLAAIAVAIVAAITVLALTSAHPPALPEAAGEPPQVKIPTDQASVKRGEKIVLNVCISCHSLEFIRNPATKQPYESRLTPEDAEATFGTVPPDLTLMARARRGGGRYIYGLLTGFEANPGDCPPPGARNRMFPGGCIAMPNPGLTKAQALDVAAYLVDVADPDRALRVRVGIAVEIYVVILTVLAYLVYVGVRRRVKGK